MVLQGYLGHLVVRHLVVGHFVGDGSVQAMGVCRGWELAGHGDLQLSFCIRAFCIRAFGGTTGTPAEPLEEPLEPQRNHWRNHWNHWRNHWNPSGTTEEPLKTHAEPLEPLNLNIKKIYYFFFMFRFSGSNGSAWVFSGSSVVPLGFQWFLHWSAAAPPTVR